MQGRVRKLGANQKYIFTWNGVYTGILDTYFPIYLKCLSYFMVSVLMPNYIKTLLSGQFGRDELCKHCKPSRIF